MTDTKIDTSTAQVKQRTEWLRLHRLDVAVASTRMPWCPDWPLDRLSVQVADDADALASERDALKEEAEKFRTAARVLCGAHIGVPQEACPVCERDTLAERVKGLTYQLDGSRLDALGLSTLLHHAEDTLHRSEDALQALAHEHERYKLALEEIIQIKWSTSDNWEALKRCSNLAEDALRATRPIVCPNCFQMNGDHIPQCPRAIPPTPAEMRAVRCQRCGKEGERVVQPGESALTPLVWYCSMECGLD